MQNKETTCFQRQMLQQIFSLLNVQDNRAAWNNTVLDKLLSKLGQSLKRLRPRKKETPFCRSWGVAVRSYFHAILHYLQEKEYSACAWEVVRKEIESSFSLLSNPQTTVGQ
jgi:hypothetical protein